MAENLGLGFPHNGVEVDNISAADSSEDEHRDNEIKKLLEEGLCNETFEYDSENSNEVSDADISMIKNGNFRFSEKSMQVDRKIYQENIAESNGATENKMHKANTKETETNTHYSKERPFNANSSYRIGNASTNMKLSRNDSCSSGTVNKSSILSGGTRNMEKQLQRDRESEEIEAKNPTISLMHTNHCPQNDDNDLELKSSLWLSADDNAEQLKTLCKFRERQLMRSEETIATLTKDKRSLNHQMGLMKSEMIQMKSQQDELEKVIHMREEEVVYLKTKIREAIEEYEQVRRKEIESKDECSRLLDEVEKLQEEVRLLSAIGTSTQHAEVDQLVRQMREKHARDTAAWQKVVHELESEVRLNKRAQQLLQEESFQVSTRNAEVQTDQFSPTVSEDEVQDQAEREFRNEFGAGDTNLLIAEKSGHSKFPDAEVQLAMYQSQWEKEKKEIVNFYEIEIDAYRSRLTSLPAKLYETWQKTQVALGINSPLIKKPQSQDVATCTDLEFDFQENTKRGIFVQKPSSPESHAQIDHVILNEVQNVSVAVADTKLDFPSHDLGKNSEIGSPNEICNSSALIQTDPKETSSVVIQTDETLETYKILAGLIEQWATEVAQNTERAKNAERQVKVADEELNKLRKRFKYLQKLATSCRKEWKKQEDSLKRKNTELKTHYVNILLQVNEKLEGIEIE